MKGPAFIPPASRGQPLSARQLEAVVGHSVSLVGAAVERSRSLEEARLFYKSMSVSQTESIERERAAFRDALRKLVAHFDATAGEGAQQAVAAANEALDRAQTAESRADRAEAVLEKMLEEIETEFDQILAGAEP